MQEKQWIAHDAYKHFGEMKKTNRVTQPALKYISILNLSQIFYLCFLTASKKAFIMIFTHILKNKWIELSATYVQ